MPLMRRLAINTPPSHCGGVLAAEQVHCELAGMRSAVKTLPLTAKFKFSTIACDRLCSKAACVVASRLAVVRVPPNKLPDGSDLVIKPPVEGRFPVSLRVPFTPETVPVTDVARPLKVMTAGVCISLLRSCICAVVCHTSRLAAIDSKPIDSRKNNPRLFCLFDVVELLKFFMEVFLKFNFFLPYR